MVIPVITNISSGKGALSKLLFGGDGYFKANDWTIPEPAALEVGMTEANFSEKNLGAGGAIIISAWLTHKDNGALQCTDGTPYQSKKSFMVSTHVCRHCGQHNTQHKSR